MIYTNQMKLSPKSQHESQGAEKSDPLVLYKHNLSIKKFMVNTYLEEFVFLWYTNKKLERGEKYA